MTESIGVAVIGAGMAGKAHAAAYRAATTLFRPTLPPVRLVSIADVFEPLGRETAARYGFERSDTDWRAIAEDPGIDVVSVVVANALHREIVEGLLAAGKHVLCEKPLSDTIEDARAMADAARAAAEAGIVARIGFSYLRAPGIAFIRRLLDDGRLGEALHFSGRYWTDYGCRPDAPISWRYLGPAGSGALGDVGSHLTYLAEHLCGPALTVSGGRFRTSIAERPVPLGAVVGHTRGAVGEELVPVTNDDYATFNAEFAHCAGTIEVSRVAAGHPNTLELEIFGSRGAARWSQTNPSVVEVVLHDDDPAADDVAGFRTVALGPAHPHYAGGWAMDAPGVGIGQNDLFVHQARAFLEEVAGIPEAESLPRCRGFEDGVHNMELLAAVAESAAAGGAPVEVPVSGATASAGGAR